MSIKKKKGNALRKNILREIFRTKSRFLAVFAIIGISVGFFSGLKSASPSMKTTALSYFDSNQLMDIRLLSTVGFDDKDIEELNDLDYVEQVMPGYSADLIISQKNVDFVARVLSLPERTSTNKDPINSLILKNGRYPKEEGECVMENYFLKMSGYDIGDTITFNPSVEGRKTTDTIKRLDYRIVGVVDSPLYLTYLRGNSTIGDGAIGFYMFLPSDQFVTERYTAVYLRTEASSRVANELSDEYTDMIEVEKERLKVFSEKSIQRFNDTTLADARKKLSDAQKEYTEKKEEAVQKLSDGVKELKEGENEFYEKTSNGRKKISDGEEELEEGKKQLEQGQLDYKNGLEEGKQKLSDAQTQYNEGLAAYNSAKLRYDTEIEKAENQLAMAQSEYDMQYQLFYSTTKPQAETKLQLMKAGIDLCGEAITRIENRLDELRKSEVLSDNIKKDITEQKKKLSEARQKLAEYQKQYDEGTKLLSDGEQQLLEAKEKLNDAQTQLAEKKAEGALQLGEAKSQLDVASGQLEEGRFEYETALSSGMLELQSVQTKITEGEKELEKGKKELEQQSQEAMLTMKAGREKLARGMYEAHVQLGDAEKKLSDAQEQLDALNDAKWYVFDRNDNPGYSGLSEDADRVDSIARVFPFFFLLIAGLVCFTTMARMVEEHRTETGTLKALGYSNLSIAMKYIIYAGLAAITGCIAGAAFFVPTLPIIIVNTYGIMYTMPPTILSVNWTALSAASAAGIVCICIVSLISCYNDLKLYPATLMRPKAPKPGKRILLEYITPLWSRMNFTSKVTARNLFRYKARFFMTVVGVAGCTALIVAGLGLRDSTTGIPEKQFDNLTIYDQIYSLAESGTAQEKAYLMSQFHADHRFETTLLANMSWADLTKKKHDRIQTVRFFIGEDAESFNKMFILRDRITHEPIPLTDDGIVVSERTGQVYGLKPGDTVSIRLEDEDYECRVTGFTENYAGIIAYMTPTYYENLTGKPLKYNIIMTRIAEDYRDDSREIANDHMKDDGIITVTSMTDSINTMMDMMKSLDFIVFVIIFCAGLLAVVVLYNLTNINISERVREIATIKVLGFYNLETANFVYREGIVLTVIGALAGLGLGNLFNAFIIQSIQMDNVMFVQDVSFLSYVLAFILTLLFSFLVNFIMYFKMKKISMVESLKSIE